MVSLIGFASLSLQIHALAEIKPRQMSAFLSREPMPRRTATASTDLSHIRTASRVANCIASDPKIPVVVHWQLPEFPIRIANKLLAQRGNVIWVVATSERGDIAERELSAAGIDVRRIRTEVTGAEEDVPSEIALLRQKLKKKAASREAQYPQPPDGTVTIMPLVRLGHRRPLEEIAGWESPLVVFDHIGVTKARWLETPPDGQPDDMPRYRTRDADSHPISVWQHSAIPMVFLSRDELEGELHRSYLASLGVDVTRLVTRFTRPVNLRVSVVGTNLVWSKYATGAFLSVLACIREVDVVGEALIGGITPDKLSMRTPASLNKTVLKISHLSDNVLELDRRQTGLASGELTEMRARDFIRTAMLAVSPVARKPELVILCPSERAGLAADLTGVVASRLAYWNPHRPRLTIKGTPFAQSVILALSTYPRSLAHGSRNGRISSVLGEQKAKTLRGKLAQLALSLHYGSGQGEDWDLARRAEDLAGVSKQADRAIAVFNRVLDEAFPWSATAPGDQAEHLTARKEVFRRYREMREERLKGRIRCEQTEAA